MGDLLSCAALSAPTLLRPCALLRAGCGGSRSPCSPQTPSPRPLLAFLRCLQQPRAVPAQPRSRPLRWRALRGLQVQGDGFGVGFFPPLNSIFSTRRSSRGSRRQLLLRETSGFAVVADALIPAPWKTLLRPAPQPPRRRGSNKIGGEKQDGEEHGSVRLRDLKQLGGMMLEALARSGIAGGSCRALGDAGGPGQVGADGDGNLPPTLGSRGFHQRGAGGGDSAARVLLGTVTASGTAWPWPVSHAPPRWLVL